MTQTVLILGAAGRFGHAAATAFHAAGWNVRLWLREGRKTDAPGRAIHGDLFDAPALARAAKGADVIVNALNPPYDKWAAEIPRLTEAAIDAAKAAGATVILPGNIYNYGSALPPVLTSETPHVGDHRKACIRIAMERAWRASGAPTIILRAGDFIDTRPGENWFEGHMTNRVPEGRIVYPGPTDLPHAWAFLPDMARAAVGLAEARADLPAFADIGFPGYTLTGEALIAAVEKAAGRKLKRGGVPWLALRLTAPFSPMMRELHDMRYLWRRPHRIDGAALAAALPGFRATPAETAIRRALAGAGRIAAEDALFN